MKQLLPNEYTAREIMKPGCWRHPEPLKWKWIFGPRIVISVSSGCMGETRRVSAFGKVVEVYTKSTKEWWIRIRTDDGKIHHYPMRYCARYEDNYEPEYEITV